MLENTIEQFQTYNRRDSSHFWNPQEIAQHRRVPVAGGLENPLVDDHTTPIYWLNHYNPTKYGFIWYSTSNLGSWNSHWL